MKPDKELKFVDINYKVLSFKHPADFEPEISKKIVSIFRAEALKGNIFLTLNDLENLYESIKNESERERDAEYKRFLYMNSWQKKDHDENDINKKASSESNKLLSDNLRILINNEIIKSVFVIFCSNSKLEECRKYFLEQINNNISIQAVDLSKKEINKYIQVKMLNSKYPYESFVSYNTIFANLKDFVIESNLLLHSLITDNYVVQIPLLINRSGKEIYEEYLFSGKAVKDSLDTFMDTNLIPTLKLRYSAMQDSLRSTFKKHNFSIAEAEIDVNQMHKVYHLCFMILEAKNIYKNVSHNDFNIAQIIINCWLAMEDDPLLSLQEFPNIELGNDFLSPFLTRYIQDFSHIADYLKIIKGFMEHLPQIIEVDDLLNFFKSKGVQKKTVETFLNHLPNDILKIQSLKHYYIISKSQIIKAIHYLYDGNFYKNTDSGRSQFEILAQAFRTIEQSTKDTNNVLNQLKTTSDEFKETKSILNKSDAYRMIEDKLEDTKEADAKLAKKKIPPNIPSKKIYTPKDFESLEEEDRDMLIKALNLMIIDCMDTHNNPYQFFIKRSDLNLDDARFFRGKPTYELICKRFNL